MKLRGGGVCWFHYVCPSVCPPANRPYFNAKLQVNHTHVKQEESRNEKILKEIIKENSLHPINLDATQGMWTRQNRKKKEEKSIIDYVLVTEQIKKNITEMIVDKEGQLRTRGKN